MDSVAVDADPRDAGIAQRLDQLDAVADLHAADVDVEGIALDVLAALGTADLGVVRLVAIARVDLDLGLADSGESIGDAVLQVELTPLVSPMSLTLDGSPLTGDDLIDAMMLVL